MVEVMVAGDGATGQVLLADLLRRSYEGEVVGEAVFSAAAAGTTDRRRHRALLALAELEAQTRDRIAPFVVPSGAVDDELADFGHQIGRDLCALAWEDLLASFATPLADSLVLYRTLADAAPDEAHADLAAYLVEHELAIEAFARGELAGATGSSLAAVLSVLDLAGLERLPPP